METIRERGIPVTQRKWAIQVTILTGHEGLTKAESALNRQWLAQTAGTIVILMGVKNLPKIAEALIAGGMKPEKPVATLYRDGSEGRMHIMGF